MQIKRHIQINTIKSRLTLVRNYTNDNEYSPQFEFTFRNT